uniref:Uncharacterized protein n=1 Tax=Ananas comosus var. bracteatus TaxID=296719 RepID=A0A6V7PQ50_ANACO|nr:unnamed protein product [Ananas comosus var. bracteatus]
MPKPWRRGIWCVFAVEHSSTLETFMVYLVRCWSASSILFGCVCSVVVPQFRGRNSFLGGENVTHWTFANCEVRVFDLYSEFFQIFWWVVDSVPTYALYPENCSIYSSAKVTKVMDLGCSRISFCWTVYRYILMVVPVQKVYR